MWTWLTMFHLCLLALVATLVQGSATQEGAEMRNPVPPTEGTVIPEMKNIRKNMNDQSASSTHPNVSSDGQRKQGSNDVGCKGLRSKRYISDGFCRTLKPISEVLCTGYCVPERYQAWYPEFMRVWGKTKVMEYRCVDGVVRHQKIKLMCDNGKLRSYKIRVVKSCACRKQVRPPYSSRTENQWSSDAGVQPASVRANATRHDRQQKGSKIRQTLSNA